MGRCKLFYLKLHVFGGGGRPSTVSTNDTQPSEVKNDISDDGQSTGEAAATRLDKINITQAEHESNMFKVGSYTTDTLCCCFFFFSIIY